MPRARKISREDGKLYELIRNISRCEMCNEVVESLSKNHSSICNCGNLCLSNGTESDRIVKFNIESITDLSVWRLVKDDDDETN